MRLDWNKIMRRIDQLEDMIEDSKMPGQVAIMGNITEAEAIEIGEFIKSQYLRSETSKHHLDALDCYKEYVDVLGDLVVRKWWRRGYHTAQFRILFNRYENFMERYNAKS